MLNGKPPQIMHVSVGYNTLRENVSKGMEYADVA
jgi:hypothetical protein